MEIGSGETRNPIWQLLRIPMLYDLSQMIAGTKKIRQDFVQQYVQPKANARVLDLGCGTGDLRENLPGCDYVGIDINASYIDTARNRYSDAEFLVGDCANFEPLNVGQFDAITAVGLLHHLNDKSVTDLSRSARAALKPGGCFCSIDPCYTDDQGSLRRWFVSKDRGRSVRTTDGYGDLLKDDFDSIRPVVIHDWGNIPWSYCVMVSTVAEA